MLLLSAMLCASSASAAELASSQSESEIEPGSARVVLLHGLARGADSMSALAARLATEGYEVANLEYDSRAKEPDELVREISQRIAACCGAGSTTLHFVTHSLGGILLRAYLAEQRPANLGRVVQLAPPNHGSEIVDQIADFAGFEEVFGATAKELGTGKDSFPNRLGKPDYELGVIAGRRSLNPLASVLLPGPDDGTVTVESTKLEGAADFIVIDATHTFIMRNEVAHQQVLHFLRTGRFDHESRESGG